MQQRGGRWQAELTSQHHTDPKDPQPSAHSPQPIRLVLVRISIPIHICISFKRRCDAAATPCCCLLQNGVCGAPTKWRRRQRKLLFATHQISCKLFEQKLQLPPRYLGPQRRRRTRCHAAVATCVACDYPCSPTPPHPHTRPSAPVLRPPAASAAAERSSAKFMATFMCRVACAVNTGNAGKKCIINDVINPHAATPTLCKPCPLHPLCRPSNVQLQSQ